MARTEAELLAEINAGLPDDVDWKQGAITYLRELVREGGEQQEWFHLLKPFVGGPDYEPFWTDVLPFLNVVRAARLAPGDVVLDVGCGPGWTVQWLAKLGHRVVGIDISAELLEIAERRMRTDPYPPFLGSAFRYELREHDIEDRPVGLERPARLALFESTLHHFWNPVAALRHTVTDLTPDGVVAVIEAAAPPPGSEWDLENRALMERYGTIERPYARSQLLDALGLAGLDHVCFLRPVDGLVAPHADDVQSLVWELTRSDSTNTFLASVGPEALERLGLRAERVEDLRHGWTPLAGTFAPEAGADDRTFRWCGPEVLLRSEGPGPHHLGVATFALGGDQVQVVRAVIAGRVVAAVELRAEAPQADLVVSAEPGERIELQSDRAFSPCWSGGDDSRLLSFMLS